MHYSPDPGVCESLTVSHPGMDPVQTCRPDEDCTPSLKIDANVSAPNIEPQEYWHISLDGDACEMSLPNKASTSSQNGIIDIFSGTPSIQCGSSCDIDLDVVISLKERVFGSGPVNIEAWATTIDFDVTCSACPTVLQEAD